ncbi:hypothetical protein ACHAWF_018883 [Thalassiosira exigua]
MERQATATCNVHSWTFIGHQELLEVSSASRLSVRRGSAGRLAMKAALFLLLCLTAAPPIATAARRGRGSPSPPRAVVPLRAPTSFRTPTTTKAAVAAFGDPRYFTERRIPSDVPGVSLRVPDFPVLFDEICKVSPLARQAMTEAKPGGLDAIDPSDDVYQWKVTDDNPKRLVSHIDKIENFQGKGVPLLRMRSTMRGPAKRRGECFSELVSTTDLRQKWDATNAFVDTIYSAADLGEVAELQERAYGTPSLFGIGYVRTKQSVVSPREQLTLCGLQEFPSGASIVWGVELTEDQDGLFPADRWPRRVPRSTSHLFATTLVPRGEEDFDVEYVLQVEIGGFPGWLTGPVVVETVKGMFRFAKGYFGRGLEGEGELAERLKSFPDEEEACAAKGEESLAVDERTNEKVLLEHSLVHPPDESGVAETEPDATAEGDSEDKAMEATSTSDAKTELIATAHSESKEVAKGPASSKAQPLPRRRKRDRIRDLLRRSNR